MSRRWDAAPREARHPLAVPSRNNLLNQQLESGPANSDDTSPRTVPQVRHMVRCIPVSLWDIYLGFIQKCLSLRKYVNCHPLAQLGLPLPTAVFDKFQYLHFSLALECSRLNRGSLTMEQSSRLALQKEPGPHPGRVPSAVTLNLSVESQAFTSFVLRSSTTASAPRVSGVFRRWQCVRHFPALLPSGMWTEGGEVLPTAEAAWQNSLSRCPKENNWSTTFCYGLEEWSRADEAHVAGDQKSFGQTVFRSINKSVWVTLQISSLGWLQGPVCKTWPGLWCLYWKSVIYCP